MTNPQPREPREQRTRLGAELRRLRMLAGLSGDALGREVGTSQKTVSRIERGESLPDLPQVTAWARATGAGSHLPVLVGLLESAVNEVTTFRGKSGGLASFQQEIRELEAVSGTVRNFQVGIVPGLLQTPAYARRVLELAPVADLAAALAGRLERQQALYDEKRRFEFLLTEAALRWRAGPPEMHAGQLGQLAALATLETVELGVIPANSEMHATPRCSFILYEDRTDGELPVVAVEIPHALLYVGDAADVEIYRGQLALFRESALTGAEAIEFVRSLAPSTG
jgi:transcriptional regulator with XRE-family HTH domain